MGDAAVLQRLNHGEIGVVELYVLAHQRDGHFALGMLEAVDHFLPVLQFRRADGQLQRFADLVGERFPLQHQGHLIERFGVKVLDDAPGGDIAEQREFCPHLRRDGIVAAADEHAGVDAHALQFLDRVLRGLGFEFLRRFQVRDEGDVDKQRALRGHFPLKLADGLDEGLPLDIADRSANFGDDDVGLFADAIDFLLDLICDVRDDLHGAAVVAAVALAL